MTLAEKVLFLRTEKGLSQEDLAAKLEVSRQSVSKWETGQSVPDLDKIIKLSDLFGVTVDELVREGERPKPPEPEVRTVYVEREKKGLAPVQKLGIVFEAVGGVTLVIGLLGAGVLILAGAALVILGLPLLLAKKHPFLIEGWLLLAMSRLFLGPHTGFSPPKPWQGFEWIYCYFAAPGPGRESLLLGGIFSVAWWAFVPALLFFTGRLWLRVRKNREHPEGG